MTFAQQVTALIAALSQSQADVVKKFLHNEAAATHWYDCLQACIDEVRRVTKGKESDEEYEVFSTICEATRLLDEVAAQ